MLLDNNIVFMISNTKMHDDGEIEVFFYPSNLCNDVIANRRSIFYRPNKYLLLHRAPAEYFDLLNRYGLAHSIQGKEWQDKWASIPHLAQELIIAGFIAYSDATLVKADARYFDCSRSLKIYLEEMNNKNKETTTMTDNTALLDKLLQPTGEEEATDYCDEHVYMFDCDPDSDEDEDDPERYEDESYEIESEFKELMEQIHNWVSECDLWLREERRCYCEREVDSIQQQLEDIYDAVRRLHNYAEDYVE